jgi:LemA protein
MDSAALLVLIVVGVAVVVPLVWLIATFNRFVRLRQHIKESWADIDSELKRRYDLIPNLVQTVQGYAAHERDTLELVTATRTRAAAPHDSASARAADESRLQLALGRLFALSESYPQLRADAQFLALQKELANTEDRIAAARRFYNGNVRDLNRLRGSFPTSIVGSLAGVEEGHFFELASEAERVAPRVG